MTVKEQREILEAYERGEEIEIKSAYRDWTLLTFKYPTVYCFNFQDFDYRIKKKRWRAEEGEDYYLISYDLKVLKDDERFSESDDRCYEAGNYFRTIDQAQKARELLKETLTKFHEENN